MNKTLILVGNSHSACRYMSADTLHHAGIPRDRISWICQGGNVASFDVDAKEKFLRPNFVTQHSSIIEIYIKNGVQLADEAIPEDEGIPLSEVGDVVLSSVGVRPPAAMMRSHICHYMTRVPTSDALVAAWVRGQNLARAIPKLAALRRAGFSGRIFATPWIRPFRLPDFCPMKVWQRYCAIEQSALRDALDAIGALLLPYPEGCEVLTDAGLTNGKPGVHGNRRYGELINRILLREAYPRLLAGNALESGVVRA